MDKYDEAVAFLTEHPDEIVSAWGAPKTQEGGCLFGFVTSSESTLMYGCLTQIRIGARAQTEKLTTEITLDIRIPQLSFDIVPENLHVFAEWQRRIDSELNRKTPCVQ